MTLYLARHGRSLGEGLFLGQSDPGLSEEGRLQSEALADQLATTGIARIASSELRRSTETAAIVGARLGLPVQPDPRWNELRYGRWDGLPWSEIERQWPAEARRKLADWWAVTPEGGEGRDAFLERIRAAWQDLRGAHEAVLLIGHAGVNGLLSELCRAAGEVDWDRVTAFQQGYGEVRRIEVK
jgi:broad specificity phosphatase PhoE